MEVNLVVVEGKPLGSVIPVKTSRFLIGRDEGCQLRPKNPAISKQHCALIRQGRTVTVQDLGSTNGTLVNDRCLRDGDKVQVADGDRLQIGQLIFSIQITAQPARSVKRPEDWLAAVGPAPSGDANLGPRSFRP